ncbi:MAG: SMI1/KNR4 family protein [Rhodospirillales bacterium]|nr:SMI1/KNR4 family protein [Rhodospirillales bacterium]
MTSTPFLRDIFRRADWSPLRSAAAERDLLAVERRIRRKLPSAFRELQALENGPAFLARFSNSDRPIDPNELAAPLARWPRYDPLEKSILPFLIENQAVCVWGIRLDGGDDPPVVVEVDSGTPPRWQRCADRFTDWLRCQVHDQDLFHSALFAAQALPLNANVLSALSRHFEEGLQTHGWPGATNYRFCNRGCRLLLWDSDKQCDWSIAPRSVELVTAVLDEIEAIAGVGRNLYAINDRDRDSLRRWQSARGIA